MALRQGLVGLLGAVAGLSWGEASLVASAPPVDVNEGRGVVGEPGDALAPRAEDGSAYRVSRFEVRYKGEHPELPGVEALMQAPVRLGVSGTGYIAPREGGPSTVMRVQDVIEGSQGVFYRSAIDQVRRALVAELNRRGVIGVFVQLDPNDVDEGADQDLRPAARSELAMVVWTGKAKQVRTIGTGERLGADSATINSGNLVHRRIRDQSPVQEGDVIRGGEVDDFVFRLNRHPGRRVDVAIAPAGGPDNPEDVQVDYLVWEGKPWSAYAEISNSGTRQTEEWRERFGFVHNQLTSHDDILRIDYITGGFQDTSAITGSYAFPLLSDRVRLRLFGSYSDFDASNVGAAGEGFEGTTWQVGGEVTGLVWQDRETFVDVFGGARFQNIQVTDRQLLPAPEAEGDENFLIPYVGIRAERATEAMSTSGSISLETNLAGLAGTEASGLSRLGRRQVDDSWVVFKFDATHSMYLEPVFDPEGKSLGRTLAHEVVASIRGQHALGSRLIANEEDVLGGMYSVRGYPESVAAGDSTILLSLEYRWHYPRTLGVGEPGTYKGKAMGVSWPFGPNFRYVPQQAYGQADWDLIFKGFLDAGRTQNSDRLIGEFDNTLIGAGVGVELQFKRNLFAKLDWGFALSEVDESDGTVDVGDNRVHFSLTFLY